jgi:hypothetical protein
MQCDDEPSDRLQAKYDLLADNVQVASEAFLGMTMGCARCHDHKKDPISQKDYYSFMAFFHGLKDYGATRNSPRMWAPEADRDVVREGASVQPRGIGVLHQARGPRRGARMPDANAVCRPEFTFERGHERRKRVERALVTAARRGRAAPGQFTISMRARDGGGGWDGGAPFMGRSVAAVGPININNLRQAIVGNESGGSFSVVNPDSGALGYGQVMPANVPSWTKEHYGKSLTPEQFLNNKKAQLAVVNGQISKIVRQQLAAGHKGDVAIRRTAAIWYSGQGDLYDDRRPQSTNGQSYPSIRDFTLDILRRYSTGG